MRLIDKDALQDKLLEGLADETGFYADLTRQLLIAFVDEQPTVNPVKHGKWELHEYPDGYYHTVCSECRAVYDEMVYFLKKAHYCPNCGAKMDGGER